MVAERGRDDEAEDLADRAAREAVDGGREGQSIDRSGCVVHASDASEVVKSPVSVH